MESSKYLARVSDAIRLAHLLSLEFMTKLEEDVDSIHTQFRGRQHASHKSLQRHITALIMVLSNRPTCNISVIVNKMMQLVSLAIIHVYTFSRGNC